MLEQAILISALISAISGLVVMWLGDWKKFALKFAGVALSTAATTSMIVLTLSSHKITFMGVDQVIFLAWGIDQFVKNIALLVLNLATGRDAIRVCKGERRKNEQQRT